MRSFEIVSLSDTLARKPRSGVRYQAILPVRAPHPLLFCCFRVILGNPWDYFGVKCSKHASHVLSSGVHLLLSSTETQNFGPAAATRNRGDCIRLVVLIHFIQLNFSVTKWICPPFRQIDPYESHSRTCDACYESTSIWTRDRSPKNKVR